jgi:hypothetical protein
MCFLVHSCDRNVRILVRVCGVSYLYLSHIHTDFKQCVKGRSLFMHGDSNTRVMFWAIYLLAHEKLGMGESESSACVVWCGVL